MHDVFETVDEPDWLWPDVANIDGNEPAEAAEWYDYVNADDRFEPHFEHLPTATVESDDRLKVDTRRGSILENARTRG
eukprot:608277-Heterocapsa_arctica.AAC.1